MSLTPERIEAINALPQPARSIMRMRFGVERPVPADLATVARHFGMTRLEVRRIEVDALRTIGVA